MLLLLWVRAGKWPWRRCRAPRRRETLGWVSLVMLDTVSLGNHWARMVRLSETRCWLFLAPHTAIFRELVEKDMAFLERCSSEVGLDDHASYPDCLYSLSR